jgi:hypothetical protein
LAIIFRIGQDEAYLEVIILLSRSSNLMVADRAPTPFCGASLGENEQDILAP